jgi:hypothetical protein
METARPGQRVFLSAASYGNVRQEKTKLDINFNLLATPDYALQMACIFRINRVAGGGKKKAVLLPALADLVM